MDRRAFTCHVTESMIEARCPLATLCLALLRLAEDRDRPAAGTADHLS